MIEKCKELCESVKQFQLQQHHQTVTMVDLSEIRSDLKDIIERMTTVSEYLANPTTDYNELLENKVQEIKAIRSSQKSWIQTEIFKMMLNFQENEQGSG